MIVKSLAIKYFEFCDNFAFFSALARLISANRFKAVIAEQVWEILDLKNIKSVFNPTRYHINWGTKLYNKPQIWFTSTINSYRGTHLGTFWSPYVGYYRNYIGSWIGFYEGICSKKQLRGPENSSSQYK